MNVIGFVGPSGSGKTTAIAALITHFVANGKTVGALKHTHHAINEEDRGDTAQFRRAGAEPVALAGSREAVLFRGDSTTQITYEDPRDLLALFQDNDIVFIEGFKSAGGWERIELSGTQRSTAELVAILDRIWHP